MGCNFWTIFLGTGWSNRGDLRNLAVGFVARRRRGMAGCFNTGTGADVSSIVMADSASI
jgi:hypothetical protein